MQLIEVVKLVAPAPLLGRSERSSDRTSMKSETGGHGKFACFVSCTGPFSLSAMAVTDMPLSVAAVSRGTILEKTTVHSLLLLSHVPDTGMRAWPLQRSFLISVGQSTSSHSVSSYLTARPGGWVMAFGHFTVTLSRSLDSVPLTFPCSNRMPGLNSTTGAAVLT